MKLVFTWLTVLSLSANCLGAPVAIRALDTSDEQFTGFLESQKGKVQSFSEYYSEVTSNSMKPQKIVTLYEQGLRYFYSGTRKIAAKYFSEIASMAYDADWPANQTAMITNAFVKLAEIFPEEKEGYLKQALNFHYHFDGEIPEKMISSWATAKGKIRIQKWDLSSYRQFDLVIVNSKVYDLRTTDAIDLPIAEHRVTFLSNLYRPQTFRMSSDQILVTSPPTVPFVDGECEKPSYVMEDLEPVVVFFSTNCIKTKKSGLWAHYDSKNQLDLSPAPLAQATNSYLPPTQPFYKKTWFWAAVGVVAGILIFNSTKKENSSAATVDTVIID